MSCVTSTERQDSTNLDSSNRFKLTETFDSAGLLHRRDPALPDNAVPMARQLEQNARRSRSKKRGYNIASIVFVPHSLPIAFYIKELMDSAKL